MLFLKGQRYFNGFFIKSRAVVYLHVVAIQFKGIFDAHDQVPTKGLVATKRFALGASLVYPLALLYRFEHNLSLRVGLKAFLRAA